MTLTDTHSRPLHLFGYAGLVAVLFSWRSTDGYWLGMLCLSLWFGQQLYAQRQSLLRSLPHGLRLAVVAFALYWLIRPLIDYSQGAAFFDPYKWLGTLGLLLFIPLFFALNQVYRSAPKHLVWLLLIPALSVLTRVISHTDWSQWTQALFSDQVNGFGRHHIHFATYCGMSFLLALGALRLSITQKAPRWQLALCVIAMALMLQGMLSSGSRSSWVALLSTLPVLLWYSGIKQQLKQLSKKQSLLLLALALLTLALIGVNTHAVVGRLSSEFALGWSMLIDPSTIPLDEDVFVGRRLLLYHTGLSLSLEAPWFGYGPGAVVGLLSQQTHLHIHDIFHNLYIDLLVEHGLVGTLIIFSLPLTLVYHVWRQGGAKALGPLGLGLYPLLTFIGVLSLFDGRTYHYANALGYQLLLAVTLLALNRPSSLNRP